MNAESKDLYDSAYDTLKAGNSAIYRQEGSGSRVDGEWVGALPSEDNITCYEDVPSSYDVAGGLVSMSDVKLLIAAKSMPLVIPKIGDTIVFSDRSLAVKQLKPLKSLEGVTVLHQLFCSRMS